MSAASGSDGKKGDGRMSEILSVKELCKENILRDVSFTVEEGEMVAVMGPSGSGKSTLLYLVSGMERASSGEIRLGDTEICSMSEEALARLRLSETGFVFQQMNMFLNLNLFDNILFPAVQLKKDRTAKKEAERRAQELMEKLSIGNLGARRITEVSGGQLQRACICRSMMNRPKILFADEPTGALNQGAAAEVMEELERIHREGTTILMVTHDCKVACRCSRILYLLDGKIEGELKLLGLSARERENRAGAWLAGMGW